MKTIFVLFLVLIALAFAAEEKSYSNQGTPYAQLSALNSQRPANCDQPVTIEFDTTESINRVKLNYGTTLKIKSSGLYDISVTPQGNRLEHNTPNDNDDFWLRINGQDVPNSANRLTLHDILTTDVTTINGIYPLEKGNTIQVIMNVVCPNQQPNNTPSRNVGRNEYEAPPTNVNKVGTYPIVRNSPKKRSPQIPKANVPAVSLSLYKI